MRVIGVTGNIGSGKSTVCHMLERRGCPVVDADMQAHETYRRGTTVWRGILSAFGPEVLGPDGEVNRTALGRRVFDDAAARERLNALVHPATKRRVQRLLAGFRTQGYEWAAVEATLLIEAGWQRMVDRIWLVASPEALVIDRLRRDRDQTGSESKARIAAQMSAIEKMEHADDIIYNDSSLGELEARMEQLWQGLTATRESPRG
ncbi:MAG: dephospho-CoA kinase [Chloroflexi bacterium]|nr:dephospho-CoA kinase [Chloroflexota bacterium]